MADLPIGFSGSMVRALLREIKNPCTGKTQTRRAMPDQTLLRDSAEIWTGFMGWQPIAWALENRGACGRGVHPRYAVGDRLYVREHWRTSMDRGHLAPRDMPAGVPVSFEADVFCMTGRFRQGMHMPRWASRITLLVTEVRIERLQDCSEADAKAEGIIGAGLVWGIGGAPPDPARSASPVEAYARLWDSINGPGAWDSNPWVAAYSFRPIPGNVDSLPA